MSGAKGQRSFAGSNQGVLVKGMGADRQNLLESG
jgi:hypothetical protein